MFSDNSLHFFSMDATGRRILQRFPLDSDFLLDLDCCWVEGQNSLKDALGTINCTIMAHEGRAAIHKVLKESVLEFVLARYAFLNRGKHVPKGGEDDNVFERLRPTEIFKHSQVSFGLATKSWVRYASQIYEAGQFSIFIVPGTCPPVRTTSGIRYTTPGIVKARCINDHDVTSSGLVPKPIYANVTCLGFQTLPYLDRGVASDELHELRSQYLKFWLTDDFPVPVLPITLKGYPEFQSHSHRAEREY
ncbi:hypothetical protein CVT26_009365 [Gymnopilus dilepis]|uniref:Uncharacterized protein n=1 Tax=Gymnopilus dilepis TaxID=231916 RepID=A0A409WCI1_9AGAR|nr:hypothetical protein CVT26_009365 [Gymnopilus dilepis]